MRRVGLPIVNWVNAVTADQHSVQLERQRQGIGFNVHDAAKTSRGRVCNDVIRLGAIGWVLIVPNGLQSLGPVMRTCAHTDKVRVVKHLIM